MADALMSADDLVYALEAEVEKLQLHDLDPGNWLLVGYYPALKVSAMLGMVIIPSEEDEDEDYEEDDEESVSEDLIIPFGNAASLTAKATDKNTVIVYAMGIDEGAITYILPEGESCEVDLDPESVVAFEASLPTALKGKSKNKKRR